MNNETGIERNKLTVSSPKKQLKMSSPKTPRSIGKKLQNLKDSKQNEKKETKVEKTTPDEWEGKDYTTRCWCDMIHNDDFMIECERCK